MFDREEQSEREENESVVYTEVTEPASDSLDTEDSGDGPVGRTSTVISCITHTNERSCARYKQVVTIGSKFKCTSIHLDRLAQDVARRFSSRRMYVHFLCIWTVM